jgi:predicted aspartyl protease
MPLTDCPLIECSNGIFRPILGIRIINPHTGLSQRTIGIIDTGADEYAVPASYAEILGHKLTAGKKKTVSTGNGKTSAYSHMTKIEIFDSKTGEIAYTVDEAPIDFMPRLSVVLLGVESFLSKFILNIDYPHRKFSLKFPTKS